MKHRLAPMLIALTFAASVWQAPAQAQGRPSKTKLDPQAVEEVESKLRSRETQQIAEALAEVRAWGPQGATVAPVVESLLQNGLPVTLAIEAMQTLSALQLESSSAAIQPYLWHRQPELRRAAATALIQTKGPQAKQALRRALSDPDPMVRGLAATGLGALGAAEYVPELFRALERNIPEAAAAIGKACAPAQCEQLAAKTGTMPLDVLVPGFEQILFRDAAQMPDEPKAYVIERLRDLGTADANKYLRDVQSRWPKSWSERVKQSIDKALSVTQASPAPSQEEP